MFDRNGDRRISARELAAVIRQALGGNTDGKNAYLSEEELIKLIQEADLMNPPSGQLASVIASNGTLEFDDFLAMMHQRMQEVNITEEVIEAFRVFDKERTGFVQIDDVKKILQKMGDGQVTKEEMNEILRELDPEGTQAFKYEEYVRQNFEFFSQVSSSGYQPGSSVGFRR